MSHIYGPAQRERYSGPLTFIGQDLEELVTLANTAVHALDARVDTLEGGTFAGDLSVADDAAIGGDLSVGGTLTANSLVTASSALTVTPVAGSNLNVVLSGAGDFAVNTNQLYVDTSAGNVGVGTASPGVRLHIDGATDNNVVIVNAIGTAPNYIFDVRDDGTSKFRVDGSGNVGIGTATPDTKLQVGDINGGSNSPNIVAVFGSGGAANVSGFRLSDNSSGSSREWSILNGHSGQSSLTGSLAFVASGVVNVDPLDAGQLVAMVINSSGNVGIGTTLPQSKLHIEGASGWIIADEQDANPTTSELDANDAFAVYTKANKLVFAYNNAGTMTYVTLDLDGSDTTWSHGTSAP